MTAEDVEEVLEACSAYSSEAVRGMMVRAGLMMLCARERAERGAETPERLALRPDRIRYTKAEDRRIVEAEDRAARAQLARERVGGRVT